MLSRGRPSEEVVTTTAELRNVTVLSLVRHSTFVFSGREGRCGTSLNFCGTSLYFRWYVTLLSFFPGARGGVQAGQGSQDSLRRKVFEALMHPRPLEGCPALKRVSRTKCEPERTTASRPIGSTCRESLGSLCSGCCRSRMRRRRLLSSQKPSDGRKSRVNVLPKPYLQGKLL